MKSQFLNKIRNQHEFIFKVLILLLTVICVVFLFPREAKFKYEFQKNKAWGHQDLYAPVDFAILKSSQEIEKEKSNIQKSHVLYFAKDIKIENDAARNLKSNLSKAFSRIEINSNDKELYQNLGVNLLSQVYSIGVYLPNSELDKVVDHQPILLINENNIGEEFEFSDLLTISDALTSLKSELTTHNNTIDSLIYTKIEEVLHPNIFFDSKLTNENLTNELKNISPTRGGILSGQKIISTGEIITEEKFIILQSLKSNYEEKNTNSTGLSWILVGQFIIISILFYALFIFLKNVSSELFTDNKNIAFLTLIMLSYLTLTIIVNKFTSLNIYMIPFCSFPLLIRTFFGNRVALFVYLVTIFIISFVVQNPFEFILIEMITGIITLFTILNVNKRSELFYTILIIFVAYAISYIGFSIIQEGTIAKVNWSKLTWFAISSGLTLFIYPLIYLFEKVFGYISDVTLLELSDTNNKLLRELNLKAPGTFQHSLQVANLAEEAIREVGGNPLLVRTGALYHDIGKMLAPAYFIENQTSGINPHDDLSYEESASIIINHVVNGVEIAKKHQLPEQIIDFIRTHHGTSKTQYFLRLFAADNPDLNIDDEMFKYPGPIPFNKETAVVMMADSVEAASRSLKVYNTDSITQLVTLIIDSQVDENQFINTEITFKHIAEVKKLFIKKLMNIYHVRVEYPK